MQTFFDIGSFKVVKNTEPVLLWEIGSNYSFLSLWTDDIKACRHIQASMFDEMDAAESIDRIYAPYKEADLQFKKVVICSAFPEALLVPRKYFSQDGNLLDLVYEKQAGHQFYDFAGQWQLVNFYSIPEPVFQFISDQFPFVSFRHVYTPILKMNNVYDDPDQVWVHFLNKQFRVLVKKNHELQLVQTYSFETPMDVVYYLLKICTEFEMSQEETLLVVSGFIENDSALYRELYQYFLNIQFPELAEVEMPEHNYPPHFFTSLINLATCVS